MTSITNAAADRVRQLLSTYPKITPEETQEILVFLKKSPALDVALLGTIEELRPALAAFRRDHAREFRISPVQWAAVAALVVVTLIGAFLLWDWGT